MKLNSLKPNEGSVTNPKKRLGRGQGSGKGGTATRGHKGAKSRSGYSKKLGFEGGQMPLQRRVPKFGFKNINRLEYQLINLDKLQFLFDEKKIKKIVEKNDLVKILGNGKLTVSLKISAHKFSKSAKKAIEKAGGEITVL